MTGTIQRSPASIGAARQAGYPSTTRCLTVILMPLWHQTQQPRPPSAPLPGRHVDAATVHTTCSVVVLALADPRSRPASSAATAWTVRRPPPSATARPGARRSGAAQPGPDFLVLHENGNVLGVQVRPSQQGATVDQQRLARDEGTQVTEHEHHRARKFLARPATA